MEGFNELLHKLRDAHERELEGWQEKVQELSNKKGCDSKRMEELFSRNQQMREQQRLLTENIKALENRLRAGLCDRCTVTQEVAKRRQQEYEAAQIQSLQHISILAGEMNNLKKDNKRLREEVYNLRRALLEGLSEHSSNSTTPEVKPPRSPDLSPSNGPVALIATATSRAPNQSTDGTVAVKTEPNQRTEETLSERRQLRGWGRGHFESFKPLSMAGTIPGSWKTENNGPGGAGERRARSVEGVDQPSPLSPSVPPHVLLLKNAPHPSPSTPGEVKPSRHVLHAPVPCRPRPIKSGHLSLPWPLSEVSDWVTLTASTGDSLVVQPNPKPNVQRFPNLIPTSQHVNHGSQSGQGRRQVVGHAWPKHSPPRPLSKEQTLVLRVRSLSEQGESPAKALEKREVAPPQWRNTVVQSERAIREGVREVNDGPLDLSDRGRSKSSQSPKDDKPRPVVREGEREEESSDREKRTDPSTHMPACSSSSSSPPAPPSSSSPSSSLKQEQSSADQIHKLPDSLGTQPELRPQHSQQGEEQAEKGTDGKADQTPKKRKVPVLTISLRPVVLLETLNAGLQKHESSSSNGKSSSTADPGSSSEEQDGEESVSGPESSQGSKRKRTALDTDTDRDSDTDAVQQERKIKIRVGPQGKSPNNTEQR